ncbi:IPT/TIG domain-containing protein [Actinoplanes friuliensis]|uniref:Cell surface receptor IPT/TIG domain-containing protein n=1 Tax=Actinoplanes friuliensis DSM 7358 TaxID=1246995 RepID=U5W5Z5_9ACTN|nr:IPT/TIG domain-containing protein [Actinoplanes friuliensis]AGZ44593.1 cell surface receptor IPT/TIG domain-containing protein [Actinoplanes friuliensis DSM 7358]
MRAARVTTRAWLVFFVAALALLSYARPASAAKKPPVPVPMPSAGASADGVGPDGSADEIAYDPWDDSAMIHESHPHVGGYIPNSRRFVAQPGVRIADVLPASVDLRADAPPVGDQGSIGACVAWTVSHNLMGYWANRTGAVDAPYAPLFLYMRNVAAGGAPNRGLNPDNVLTNVQANGVDSQDDYFQGTSNYKVPPTSGQIANARNYRVSGWTRLWTGVGQGPNARTVVQQALANGMPVALGFGVFQDFMDLKTHTLYDTTSGTSLGGHMITAFGYDSDGVIIRNQWGSSWGNGGDAKVSWDFITTVVSGAYTISGITTPASPVGVTPLVSALSATKGPAGTTVTITGAGLVKATRVAFGGTTATFTKNQNNGVTKLVATAPAHAAGLTDVTVTNPTGTSDSSGTADDFTYQPPPPALNALSPVSTSQDGGAVITLTGKNLSDATSIRVGTSVVTPDSVTDTSVRFTAPARSPGSVPVTITTPGGTSGSRYLLYVAASVPTLTTLSPSSGATTATTIVVITGTNLINLRSVMLGSTKLSYTPVNSTTIKVFVKPRAAGASALTITTAGGTSNTLTFTAVAPVRPVVSSLSPAVGLITASTPVTVTGTGFTGATRLSLGGRAMTFTRVSATQLRFTAPAHRAGSLPIIIVGPGGTSAAKTFTYKSAVPPSLTSLSKTTGSTTSMTTTVITGLHLSKATLVTAGGKRTSFKRISDTRLSITLVRRAAGPVQITVRSAGGTSNALTFTYVAPL